MVQVLQITQMIQMVQLIQLIKIFNDEPNGDCHYPCTCSPFIETTKPIVIASSIVELVEINIMKGVFHHINDIISTTNTSNNTNNTMDTNNRVNTIETGNSEKSGNIYHIESFFMNQTIKFFSATSNNTCNKTLISDANFTTNKTNTIDTTDRTDIIDTILKQIQFIQFIQVLQFIQYNWQKIKNEKNFYVTNINDNKTDTVWAG